MSIATDLESLYTNGPYRASYVYGAETGYGQFMAADVVGSDTVGGGAELRNVRVFRVVSSRLAAATYGDALTIGGTAYVVRDNRLINGGAGREVYVA